MLKTVEKNFRYHEFYTDSENFVRDIARLLAMGYTTDAIVDGAGNVVKPSLPVIDGNWEIVYPKIDKREFPDVEDWDRLTPEEYDQVTRWQLGQITDSAIIKTTTLPKSVTRTANVSGFGFDDDLNKASCTMHLELYMPPYLCDTEGDDPLLQKTGYVPKVLDRRGYDPVAPLTKIVRNYYHAFFRIFDTINEEGTGPKENDIDPVTKEVRRWNSRTSEWSKLAWYNDFEDVYVADLNGKPERGMLDGVVRMPVEPGISMQTKIKLWANVNRDRLVLSCMGSPNIDFSDDRYLIGAAYVGSIDSFDFSINDTAGNFGIFTTSSSVPSIGETEVQTRKARPLGERPLIDNPAKPGTTIPDAIVPIDNPLVAYMGDSKLKAWELKQLSKFVEPGVKDKETMDLMPTQDVPKDSTRPNGGPWWGVTYVEEKSLRVAVKLSHIPIYTKDRYGNDVISDYKIIYTEANTGVVKEKLLGLADKEKVLEITSFESITDPDNRKNVKVVIDMAGFLFELQKAYGIPVDIKAFECSQMSKVQVTFNIYTEFTTQTGGVTRDRFGNIVKIEYRTRYGRNSANSTTDFAMYHTFGKDYFQKHHFMFTSTEEFMEKELYGKSVYTGEYFADRIKVVHGSEGPRGILKAMITVDTSSLYPFDELIVNKDFKKYENEPEELFVYLPITSPYCPFANSPNGRHGIGILKEIRYPIPTTDDDFVAYALRELERKYGDLKYVTEDISLIDLSEHGVAITWESSDETAIAIVDPSAQAAPTTKSKRGRD